VHVPRLRRRDPDDAKERRSLLGRFYVQDPVVGRLFVVNGCMRKNAQPPARGYGERGHQTLRLGRRKGVAAILGVMTRLVPVGPRRPTLSYKAKTSCAGASGRLAAALRRHRQAFTLEARQDLRCDAVNPRLDVRSELLGRGVLDHAESAAPWSSTSRPPS